MAKHIAWVIQGILVTWIVFGACGAESPADRVYVPPADGMTAITMDGEGGDWEPYPAVIADPRRDSLGETDISYVYAFANDRYLYMMVETDRGFGDYSEIDVFLLGKGKLFAEYRVAVTRGEDGLTPSLEHIHRLGSDRVGTLVEVAQGSVFEMRLPLEALGEFRPFQLSVSILAVRCRTCVIKLGTIDSARAAKVLWTEEHSGSGTDSTTRP